MQIIAQLSVLFGACIQRYLISFVFLNLRICKYLLQTRIQQGLLVVVMLRDIC